MKNDANRDSFDDVFVLILVVQTQTKFDQTDSTIFEHIKRVFNIDANTEKFAIKSTIDFFKNC